MKDLSAEFRSGKSVPIPMIHFLFEKGRTRREMLLDVWRHKNIGYIPSLFLDVNFLVSKYMNEHPTVAENPVTNEARDWFGVSWTVVPEKTASSPTPNAPLIISDITKWGEQVVFPDISNVNWEKCGAEETACWNRKNRVSMMMLENGIFERSQHLLGFENALIAMYTEREAYEELLDAITDFKCKVLDIIGKYYKPDIVMCHDDYGANKSMIISPDMWQELFKPRLKRLIDTAHQYGMFYEHHSCGYIEPIIGDLVDIGVDSLNPLQICNDLKTIKEKYGKQITLCGGFDSQGCLDNLDIPKKEIRKDVKRAYDTLAPDGAYVSTPIVINYNNCVLPMLLEHYKIARKYKK